MPLTSASSFAEASPAAVDVLSARTKFVPAVVPSLVHNSPPAMNSTRLPARTNEFGCDELGPVKASFTCTVPAAVPSLIHGSSPLTPSLAAHHSVPLTLVKVSAATSFKGTVPAAVPSLFHNCPLLVPPVAKNSVPWAFAKLANGANSTTSLTSVVPAAVPSLRQSWASPLTWLAENSSTPFTFVSDDGDEPAMPALMSLTWTVPAAVPSLFHSSRPVVPSLAAK